MADVYVIANLDKKEFVSPFELGDGAKLVEFACREWGPTNVALALLLAKNPLLPGGGAKLVGGRAGTWCGDRIAIVGSYEDRLPGRDENLYEVITGQYEGDFAKATKYSNISKDVLHMVRAYLMACKSPYAP